MASPIQMFSVATIALGKNHLNSPSHNLFFFLKVILTINCVQSAPTHHNVHGVVEYPINLPDKDLSDTNDQVDLLKRNLQMEGILIGKREYPSQGIMLGKREYPTEGILLGRREYPTEGVLLGRREYPTEGIMLGRREYPTEGILLGRRGYPTEGIMLGKRKFHGSPSKLSMLAHSQSTA